MGWRSGGAAAVSAHKTTHISGGADAFAAGELLDGVVRRLRETSGPTDMLIGAVADGELLQRSGTAIVGAPTGKLVLVEDKIITAATTTVTFSGLAGDTDLLYLLQGRVKATGGASISLVSVRPNGTTTGLSQFYTRTSASTASYGGGTGASVAVGQFSAAAAEGMHFMLWIRALRTVNGVACYRYFHGTGGHSDLAGPSYYSSLIGGAWANSADEITSLDITSSVASYIGNGSRFTLWKVAHS